MIEIWSKHSKAVAAAVVMAGICCGCSNPSKKAVGDWQLDGANGDLAERQETSQGKSEDVGDTSRGAGDAGPNDWYPCDSDIQPERCQGHKAWDKFEQRDEWIDRGELLVEHLSFCGGCHGNIGEHTDDTGIYRPREPLSGFDGFYRWDFAPEDDARGGLYAPNLTPHPTGLGTWTPSEVRKAFTRGLRPEHDQRYPVIHPVMPYWTYANMSSRDQNAVLAFLHQLEPTKKRIPNQRQPMPEGSAWSVLDELRPSDVNGDGQPDGIGPFGIERMPETTLGTSHEHYADAKRGKYLATIAGCAFCHTPFSPPDNTWGPDDVIGKYDTILDVDRLLGGGRSWRGAMTTNQLDTVYSQNITGHGETGIGNWKIPSIVNAIRTGMDGEGHPMCPPAPAYAGPMGPYGGIPKEVARDLAWYLKTSEPLESSNRDCVPPPG